MKNLILKISMCISSFLLTFSTLAFEVSSRSYHPSYKGINMIMWTKKDILDHAIDAQLGELSLQSIPCITPPKAPPDKLLKRVYKANQVVNLSIADKKWIDKSIHKIDLNGDGICDWLRQGVDQHRTDQGWANPEEFLYLGTKTGWRESAQTPKGKAMHTESLKNPSNPYYGTIKFKGFFAPWMAFVHENSNPRPFVVVSEITEDRVAPGIFRTFRWDDELDNFQEVPLKQHAAILVFLEKEICRKDQTGVVSDSAINVFTKYEHRADAASDTRCLRPKPESKK